MPFAVKRRHEIEKKIKKDASKCRTMSEFFGNKVKKDVKKDELTSPETDNSGSSEEHDLQEHDVGTRATFDFYMFVIVLLRGRETVTQNSRRSAEYHRNSRTRMRTLSRDLTHQWGIIMADNDWQKATGSATRN